MEGVNSIQGVIKYATKKVDKPYKKQTFAIKGGTNNDKRKNVKSN
jgi:hypothetical protein